MLQLFSIFRNDSDDDAFVERRAISSDRLVHRGISNSLWFGFRTILGLRQLRPKTAQSEKYNYMHAYFSSFRFC